jgi:membrane protein implicated in regulation of membrane protease activity
MNGSNRNALIAAAIIMLVFGVTAFYLPSIMLAVGETSPLAAGVVAVLFVAALFILLWLRGRSQQGKDD